MQQFGENTDDHMFLSASCLKPLTGVLNFTHDVGEGRIQLKGEVVTTENVKEAVKIL